MLLENEVVSQTRSPQTEYSEFIEQATPFQRINAPQESHSIQESYSQQSINYRNPQ